MPVTVDVRYRYLMTSLATWATTVPIPAGFPSGYNSVVQGYDLNTEPEKLDRSNMPCAVLNPPTTPPDGYQYRAFMGGTPEDRVQTEQTFYILDAKVMPAKLAMPLMHLFYDAIKSAADAQKFLDTRDPNLGAKNQVVFKFKPDFGVRKYAGLSFHTIMLIHQFTLYK